MKGALWDLWDGSNGKDDGQLPIQDCAFIYINIILSLVKH